MTTTPEQRVRAIAFLIEDRRDTAGHPAWDQQGIFAQVLKLLAAGESVELIIAAGCSAADDPNARTPAAMTWTQHRNPSRARPTQPRSAGMCDYCGRSRAQHERWVERFPDDAHDYEGAR